MSESHHITRPARPDWDARIERALAARDRHALARLAREAAAHAACGFGATWLDASRAAARAQAALRFLPSPRRRTLAGWGRHA